MVSGHRPSLLPSGSNGGRHGIASDGAIRSEAIRHFSKILDSRRSTPQGFFAECYIHRAGAYQFTGRIAEAIADCNHTLALDPTSIRPSPCGSPSLRPPTRTVPARAPKGVYEVGIGARASAAHAEASSR
ncbi:hypothetical protein H6P81_005011 [Aristolochia fimbriata]|uniref:Tetratricopeptide repeat protein n=1 Tax=Aristolochia fimbriata TaxID=158543 RepID=A0AAV7ETD5_ARIFI|nr:hypothetical protein H6P81_005011 [Aristolochia fimbriata]